MFSPTVARRGGRRGGIPNDIWDENVFDCPARERHGECVAKLAEPTQSG